MFIADILIIILPQFSIQEIVLPEDKLRNKT